MEGFAAVAEIIGPIGVLVVVVTWAIMAKRNGTGSKHEHDQTDALMLMMGGLREDIRELRHEISRHLQDHAKI